MMGIGGGPIVVLFPADAGFTSVGSSIFDDCVDGGDGADGGDNADDEGWPVDGTNGIFVLDCAKATLIQLAIVTIPMAIIAKTRKTAIVFLAM